jgi:hypothetical protein
LDFALRAALRRNSSEMPSVMETIHESLLLGREFLPGSLR